MLTAASGPAAADTANVVELQAKTTKDVVEPQAKTTKEQPAADAAPAEQKEAAVSAVAAASPSAEAPSAPSLRHGFSVDQGAEEAPAAEGHAPLPVIKAREAKLATVAGPSYQPEAATVDSAANGELTRLDVRGDCNDERSSYLVTVWRHPALLFEMPVPSDACHRL